MMSDMERPLLAGCVEKLFLSMIGKFLEPLVRLTRFDARGPHQSPQKRPPALVSILQSLAVAEFAHMQHLRDFRSPAIFEFFNTIGAKRSLWMLDVASST
jgi:hypothetical protein